MQQIEDGGSATRDASIALDQHNNTSAHKNQFVFKMPFRSGKHGRGFRVRLGAKIWHEIHCDALDCTALHHSRTNDNRSSLLRFPLDSAAAVDLHDRFSLLMTIAIADAWYDKALCCTVFYCTACLRHGSSMDVDRIRDLNE